MASNSEDHQDDAHQDEVAEDDQASIQVSQGHGNVTPIMNDDEADVNDINYHVDGQQ